MTRNRLLTIAVCFTILAAAFRFLHVLPPGAAPIGALALWAGAYCTSPGTAAVVLGAMLPLDLVDIAHGRYDLATMLAVYASMFLFVLIGASATRYAKGSCGRGRMFAAIAGGTVLGSVAFYLITNAAVWAFAGWYPKTAAGFAACMAAGIPFFRNALAGNLAGAAAFFGISAAASRTALNSATYAAHASHRARA